MILNKIQKIFIYFSPNEKPETLQPNFNSGDEFFFSRILISKTQIKETEGWDGKLRRKSKETKFPKLKDGAIEEYSPTKDKTIFIEKGKKAADV